MSMQHSPPTDRLREHVEASGSTLMHTPGIGPMVAARLIARTGPVDRFAIAAAYANYFGAAPIEIASADRTHHRLSRRGDRQLNSALHTIAVIQVCTPGTPGRGQILTYQAQHQSADRAHGTRPPHAPGSAVLRVPPGDQVAVPSEHGVRAHDQVQVPQHACGQMVQQRREQGSITRGEPHSVWTELLLQDRELVP